jgi:hypothetical protein
VRRWLIAALLVPVSCWADLPNSGYLVVSPPAPDAALTDFTYLVAVTDATWWAAVDTADATKGRAALDTSGTECATDWIHFNSSTPLAIVRVLYPGSTGATPDDIRIYPPQAANTSYAAGDTYGQYAAYDSSWLAYWPQGGGGDRTSNANTATAGGSGPTVGGIPGQVGTGTDYDGSNDVCVSPSITITTAYTLVCWIWPDNVAGSVSPKQPIRFSGDTIGLSWDHNNASFRSAFYHRSATSTYTAKAVSISSGTWNHTALTWDGTSVTAYLSGAVAGSPSSINQAFGGGGTVNLGQGLNPSTNSFDGKLDDVSFHGTGRSAAWIEEEYEQAANNATYLGSPTWVPPSGGASIAPIAQYYRRLRN